MSDCARDDLPSPPFIDVNGVFNFRDIGGYPITASSSASPSRQSVRRGFVFRSADPSSVTRVGTETLSKELKLCKIFDLRSLPEIEKQQALRPIQVVDGAERIYAPAFRDEDYSPEMVAARYADYTRGDEAGFSNAYKYILINAAPSYRVIFEHIRDHPDQPFLIHCSAGKDRTGVLVALMLEIAGATPDTIAKEYNLTEKGLVRLKELLMERLLSMLHGDRGKADRMGSAKYENMIATLKMIHEDFGGSVGYLTKTCGLTEEDVQKIRANLTSDEAPILN